MRHTAATIALNDGVTARRSLAAARAQGLGYHLIVYSGTTDEGQRRAAEKLGELFGGG